MYELLGDIHNIQVYLDDILITSNGTFEEHAEIMEKVLHILQKANYRANLQKCYFGESEIDYLGYEIVNTSGKAGAQIPQLPLGGDSPPWGR
jgi:hypothetical protein